MSVVYPEPVPNPAPASAGSRLVNFAQEHIVLAGVMLLALALAIGFLVNKIRGGSSSSTQQPQTLYVPTQNTFENVYTSGGSSGGSALPPPSFQGPPTPGGSITGTVRAAGQFPTWDSAHSGVPIRSSPDGSGSIIGYAPWGSQVNLGAPVSGTSNQSGDPNAPGSSQWFPYSNNGQSGFISRADLAALNLGAANGTVQGTGSGDPFHDGHPVALRTIFSMNHGVSHHVNNVIGA